MWERHNREREMNEWCSECVLSAAASRDPASPSRHGSTVTVHASTMMAGAACCVLMISLSLYVNEWHLAAISVRPSSPSRLPVTTRAVACFGVGLCVFEKERSSRSSDYYYLTNRWYSEIACVQWTDLSLNFISSKALLPETSKYATVVVSAAIGTWVCFTSVC